MMIQTGFLFLFLGSLLQNVLAECPNACSSHGKCGAYDMCSCFRNWVANDCSERQCQFGLAHVDTPKGDLDSSGGALTSPDTTVVVNDQFYPYGTTEQYPQMVDTLNNVLTNTAHEYRECSNKGICDRTTGTCTCFEGYEGSACQRASCPSGANGVCSGHGTCRTIQEIADADFNNIYELWDKDATMGCVCDPGYEGADCSQRLCKYAVDPLYKDNNATIRYSNWTYFIYTTSSTATVYGEYSLVFTDHHDMKWKTEPVSINASCVEIEAAFYGLPNNVIPSNSVRCYQFPIDSSDYSYGQKLGVDPIYETAFTVHSKYTVAFTQNPGRLPMLSLDTYLDGSRPTLYTDEVTTDTLGWKVYPNGYHGEDVDQVPDRCYDVTVTVRTASAGFDAAGQYTSYLSGLTAQEAKLLKTCLGDSNGDDSDNVEVYNWDYGNYLNPHLIKLKEATQYNPSLRYSGASLNGLTNYDPTLTEVPVTTLCTHAKINEDLYGDNSCSNIDPPGFFAVLYYDDLLEYPFRLYTYASKYYDSTTEFFVYTTTGYLNLVNPNAVVFNTRPTFSASDRVKYTYGNVLNVVYADYDKASVSTSYFGDMSCENTPVGTDGARDCFDKGDWAMFLQTRNSSNGYTMNPSYPNMYRIAKIWKSDMLNPNISTLPQPKEDIARLQIVLDYNMNSRFQYINGTAKDSAAYAYKFHPPTNADGGYKYVKPCAGRGICNSDNGLCECFTGYSGDDCTCQWCSSTR